MKRCEECGSWEGECSSDDLVPGCGCARCANARIRVLEAALRDIADPDYGSSEEHIRERARAVLAGEETQ